MKADLNKLENHLSQTIDITYASAMYDASIRELLADKQILARILKYSVDDFYDSEIDEIISWMNEPFVASVRLEPGQTNSEKMPLLQSEDSVLGEGKIYYDIRCDVWHNGIGIKCLFNLEAQKSADKGKLGYSLDNRIIFYMSRMVSAQKNAEFIGSDYDNIKPIRSIWICMDAGDEEESITGIELNSKSVYGKPYQMDNLGKFKGVIIRIRSHNPVNKAENELIAMLEELIRTEDADIKKRKLRDEYGLKMNIVTEGKVNTMCNWSEAVAEHALNTGIERGIEQTLEIITLINKNISDELIMREVGCSLDVIEQVKKAL